MTKCKLQRLFNTKSYAELLETLTRIYRIRALDNEQATYRINYLIEDVVTRFLIFNKVLGYDSNLITFKILNKFYCSLDPQIRPFGINSTNTAMISTSENTRIIRDAINRKFSTSRKEDLVNYLLDITYDLLELEYPQYQIFREI